MTMKFTSSAHITVWSPCSKFVAVAWGRLGVRIRILDAVTLGQITTLESPSNKLVSIQQLVFSPDAHLLTCISKSPWAIISWDLHTGVLVNTISPELLIDSLDCSSATYSACGSIFGILFHNALTSTICTYNILSNTCIYSHSVEGAVLCQIWTHDKCLQFATKKPESIIIWEVEFTSIHMPTEVRSLPIPDNFNSQEFSFHPTLPQLAFIVEGTIFIWDTQDSKFLLDFMGFKDKGGIEISFSHDGRFFVCGAHCTQLFLWKESPTGYTLHQKLTPNSSLSKPLISPNGESIIAVGQGMIQLWRITHSTIHNLTTSTLDLQERLTRFVLGFSPDEALAAITQWGNEVVTVLDLKSGIPYLTIDADMSVYGLGVVGRIVVVVGDGMIVTWDLPIGDCILNPRVNVNNSIWITTFNPPLSPYQESQVIVVSPTLQHVAIMELDDNRGGLASHLYLYDVYNGQCVWNMFLDFQGKPGFALGGLELWCCGIYRVTGWKIIEDSESGATKLEDLEPTSVPPDGSPWKPHGYKITYSGWILNSSGKQLLWLPPHWQLHLMDRMWGGQFLALLPDIPPDAIILELE